MAPRTLPREPWRGSQICGWQISAGAFCAERKADGVPLCSSHIGEALDKHGHLSFAEGNACGGSRWAVRLLWQPHEGNVPIEPSYEEMARYAGALRGGE